MLLIFNTIESPEPRQDFDTIASQRIFKNIPYHTIYLNSPLPHIQTYSHLLLTGSELSAASGSPYDQKIIELILNFVEHDKAVLGICHGHQMLARALAAYNVCRRSDVPEFGFKTMNIKSDFLFKNIIDPVFFESRYDEVFDLGTDYNIIAANHCPAVQAFHYKNLPVWGVQFHPEFLFVPGQKSLNNHFQNNPDDKKYYLNQLSSPSQLLQNQRIFDNFLKA